jgi:hypothetical protein
MSNEIQIHDLVALLEDTNARHFETGQSLILRRGQIGTVVMNYGDQAFEVEFAAKDGRTYALLALESDKLMLLRDAPESAVA